MYDVDIYTDGGSRGNGQEHAYGSWGWAMVIADKKMREDAGHYTEYTTNNQNELFAVIQGLRSIQPEKGIGKQLNVTVYADSAYVVNAINKHWLNGWVKKGWKNSKNQDVANRELWEMLLVELDRLKREKTSVSFKKVKGHAGDKWNEYVDALVNWAMDTRHRSYKDLTD